MIVATWYLTRGASSRERLFAGGLVVALGARVKLTPILLLPWLIATKRWSAAVGTLVGLAALGLVGVAPAGWNAHLNFLDAGTQSATAGVTGAGPETLALLLGVPSSIARLTPAVVAVASVAWVVAFRARPGWAFVGAVAGVVLVTPGELFSLARGSSSMGQQGIPPAED
jgi:Glycosyltransferase family 87